MWIEIFVPVRHPGSIHPSLPLRKCGLKLFIIGLILLTRKSLPLRKCGLKYPCYTPLKGIIIVTSLAEVWIEIQTPYFFTSFHFVTSLAEVWIEILNSISGNTLQRVTSLAEVWIEIAVAVLLSSALKSLPLRKCGLKYLCVSAWGPPEESHFPCGSVD